MSFRGKTEWGELVNAGAGHLVGNDPRDIRIGLEYSWEVTFSISIYADEKTANKIVENFSLQVPCPR